MDVEISYCVVNTAQPELLERCLEAIAREQATAGLDSEVLVVDNASDDGSAEMARAHRVGAAVIALERRQGKAQSDTLLLARARGRFALLLNEDSELAPGATAALRAALAARPRAGAAGARLLRPDGRARPSAWRFPGPASALAGAVLLHRRMVVQSRGEAVRTVAWVQSAAMLVRREAAAQVGYLDPAFFVYSDEVDFCRRLRDAGWSTLYVPGAAAIHHEQLATGAGARRRIVELHRNRDRYMRKHHSPAAARAVRWLTAVPYAVRALAAPALADHDAARYRAHVAAALRPDRGEGVREAAEAFNRTRRS